MCLDRKIYRHSNTGSEKKYTTYYRINENNDIKYMIDDTVVSNDVFRRLPNWIPTNLIDDHGKLKVKGLPVGFKDITNSGKLDGGGNRFHNRRLNTSRKNSITNKKKYGKRLKKSGNKSGTNRQSRGKVRGYK